MSNWSKGFWASELKGGGGGGGYLYLYRCLAVSVGNEIALPLLVL